MKFYGSEYDNYYLDKIYDNKLNAIYFDSHGIRFFKNGIWHNPKNASYVFKNGNKIFCLNNYDYGNEYDFTKESWRRFVKMQVFL